MDRVHIGDFRGADHLRNIQIAFAAARRADADGFIGEADVERIAIRLRIDGDGRDAQLFARADDSQGDFPAVSN